MQMSTNIVLWCRQTLTGQNYILYWYLETTRLDNKWWNLSIIFSSFPIDLNIHLEKNIFYFNCSFPLRDLVDSVVGVWIWEHQRVPGGTIIYTQLGGRRLHGDDGECFGEKKMVKKIFI